MKELFAKYKNIILALVIAIVVFFLYNIFLAGDGNDGKFLGTEGVGNEQSAVVGKEFLGVLLELRSLKLDEGIFSDRAFIILRDFSQEVSPQASGRPNPFADIGNDPVETVVPESTIPAPEGQGSEEPVIQ